MLTVEPFRSDIVESAAERLPAFLVENPSIVLVDFIGVQSGEILDAWKLGKLWFGDSAEGEEEGTEPYLFEVGLVGILSDDLFDGELSSAFDVFSQPH